MAWITYEKVESIVHTDLSSDPYIEEIIGHAQVLSEIEIGTQTEPVTASLAAALTQIVARMWRSAKAAASNPEAATQQTAGPFSVQNSQASVGAGLGLTDAERRLLHRAAGTPLLGVVRTTRGDLETPAVDGVLGDGYYVSPTDDLDWS